MNRREFHWMLGAAAAGLPASAAESKITGVSRGRLDLIAPRDTPPGETWHYQIALPFQVTPVLAAIFCNVRKGFAPGGDFETGNDVVLFDDPLRVRAESAVVLSRNQEEANPHDGGKRGVLVKYPSRGGFIPVGCRRADGSPHPCAGTGFAINQALAWPLQSSRQYSGAQTYQFFELQQLAFDGKTIRISSHSRVGMNELVDGWLIHDGGLTNAIPDGDDLIVGMTGGRPAGSGGANDPNRVSGGAGMMRWKRRGDRWMPVSFVPVTGQEHSFEPSLIRDVDGSLLFSARGTQEGLKHAIRVWRSADGGNTWKEIIHVRNAIASTPVSLNQAADGTPYVAANLYEVLMRKIAPEFRPKPDAEGRVRGAGWQREKLSLWPLNPERNGLEVPIIARDTVAEFGLPPHGSTWTVDHPSAATVRLADGKWHNVLGYRSMERGEMVKALKPTRYTGTFLEEVYSAGPARAAWRF